MIQEKTPLLLQDAYDTTRILHDAELIKSGAAVKAGRLVLSEIQLDTLTSELGYAGMTPNLAAEDDGTQTLVRAETVQNPKERLRELVQESAFVAYTWLVGKDIPKDKGENKHGCLQSVYNKNGIVKNSALQQTDSRIKKAFSEAGVAEVVTRSSTNRTFGSVDPSSSKKEERLTIISYETTNGKYKAYDPMDRPGNILRYHICLPESNAAELFQIAQKDPSAMRTLADVMMQEEVGAVDSWAKARPPYDQWAAQDGGEAKMAFRESLSEDPAKAIVQKLPI